MIMTGHELISEEYYLANELPNRDVRRVIAVKEGMGWTVLDFLTRNIF